MSTPVFLIGGLGVHVIDWNPLIPHLENRVVHTVERHALTVDVSQLNPDDPIRLADWQTELNSLSAQLDEIGEPAIVVGHSMGAILAEGLARLHPEKVTRLVLVDGSSPLRFTHNGSAWERTGSKIKARTLTEPSAFGSKLMALVARLRGHDDAHKELFTKLYGNRLVWRQVLVEFFAERGWARQLQRIARTHPLTVPVTVVVALGGFGPRGYWERRQRRYFNQLSFNPNNRFYVLQQAKHMIMLTHPEELARIITED